VFQHRENVFAKVRANNDNKFILREGANQGMVFPFRKIWDPEVLEDAGGRIDRALTSRTKRLMIGLNVNGDFDSVDGALVVSEGHGKFMRIEFAVCVSESISESIRKTLRSLVSEPKPLQIELKQLSADLAEIQAATVDRLLQKAGKYVNRVLGVAVSDPGLWLKDFDGSATYTSLCDPNRLAELSGVTIIDGFPAQDVIVGGQGKPLSGLPAWLLMSDRDRRVATDVNAAFLIGDQFEGYLLPPSDGLDVSIPSIEPVHSLGMKFFDLLIRRLTTHPPTLREIDALLVAGAHHPGLLGRWENRIESAQLDQANSNGASYVDFTQADLLNEMAAQAVECSQQGISIGDIFCTTLELIVNSCKAQTSAGLMELQQQYEIEQERIAKKLLTLNAKRRSNAAVHRKPDFSKLSKLVVAAKPEFERAFLTRFQNAFPDTEIGLPDQFVSTESESATDLKLDAVLTAILGLMHVDQMPGNLPELTGCEQQRILGRLTPGRPHQWRQLLREMADFQPPVMKLKDAV
jgi:hypothetical protein